MSICTYCGKEHTPAAQDKHGRPVCAVCAWAALRLCADVFGRMPRKEARNG